MEVPFKVSFVLRNVVVPDRGEPSDILISGEKIERIVPRGALKADIPGLDCQGNVALPSFVDSHIHLDKAFLIDRSEYQDSVAEKLRVTRELKRGFTKEDVKERALRGLRMAASNGTGRMRTSVDIDPVVGMGSLEGLLELKKDSRHLVDLQVVAFAQEGLFRHSDTIELLRKAMEFGADLLGGHTGMDVDPANHIDTMLTLAKEFNVDVEFHVDESGKPDEFWLAKLAQSVIKAGYEGRVSSIHCCSLATVDDRKAKDAIKMVKDAGMCVLVSPGIISPTRKITRVSELIEAGVTVALGSDNLRDTWYPLGNVNLMLSCYLLTAANRLFSGPPFEELHNLITYNGARVLKASDYGLAEGTMADVVILQGESFWQALLAQRPVKAVLKRGQLVSE
jgi:cytosine deaminase